jgi:hypothetical protein
MLAMQPSEQAEGIEMSKLLHDEHIELDSNVIHVLGESSGGFEVWLNTDVADYDGLCIGCGSSRDEAVADAMGVFIQALEKLRSTKEHDDGSDDIS